MLLIFFRVCWALKTLSKVEIVETKSAQQQVWIQSNLQTTSAGQEALNQEWQDALTMGSDHLVILQQEASLCWWNLNPNQQNDVLAQLEVSCCRIA